jgi:hypothetical protein
LREPTTYGIAPQLRYVTATDWHIVLVVHATRQMPPTHSEPTAQGREASQSGCGRVSGMHTRSSLQYRPAPQDEAAPGVHEVRQRPLRHACPALHCALLVQPVAARSRQNITEPAVAHSCPSGHEPAPQLLRHSLLMHTRPAPHWLSNWHVVERSTQRPETQTRPLVHCVSVVQPGLVLTTHAPLRHTSLAWHCVLLVHVGVTGVGVVPGRAQKRVPPAPVTQARPLPQSRSLVQPWIAQPVSVHTCPTGHSLVRAQVVGAGGVTVRQDVPSQ